jgi:hypothetical protein
MGIYDRDSMREDDPGDWWKPSYSIKRWLIIGILALSLLDLARSAGVGNLSLKVNVNTATQGDHGRFLNSSLRMNHIFIDYENMKTVDPEILGIERTTFTLLLGPQNKKIDVSVVQKLLERAGSVELVRLEKQGRNAVDLTLAYYLGRKVAGDSAAYFHVVAADSDYGPLIEHLRSRHVHVRHHQDFSTVAAAIKPKANAPAARSMI